MKTKLIVALDVDSFKEVKEMVELLYPKVKVFKVGMKLFTAEGPRIIRWLIKRGVDVFLDLKLYDIPHTMGETAKVICKLRVSMFTVHLAAGRDALIKVKEAVFKEAKKLKIKRPLIIGVTVLTSQKTLPKKILNLVKIAQEIDLDGIVASVKDVGFIRKKIKKRFIFISPGIRLEKIRFDDQKRTATAKEAKENKVDYIVIGRPILEAVDPQEKVKEILDQLR